SPNRSGADMPGISKESMRRIDQATKLVERLPREEAKLPKEARFWAGGQWFYTTVQVPAASRSGTTKANSKLTLGKTGKGVPCLMDSNGDVVPDVNAPEFILICGVIPTTAPTVAADRFVFCVPWGGKWLVVHVASCT